MIRNDSRTSANVSPSNDLVLRDTPPHGTGVFAGRTFHAGEMIIEFTGTFYTSAEMPSPYEVVEDKWLQVGEDLYFGPPGGCLDEFINHSCDPNAALKISEATGSHPSVWLFALREIREGEEITYDYSATMLDDDWQMVCQCGSEHCRKLVREFRFLPPEVQRRYIALGIVPDYVMKQLYNARHSKNEADQRLTEQAGRLE